MIVEPGKAVPLTDEGFAAASRICSASPEEMWAIVKVETAGCGFLPDRRPTILFERHVFFRKTYGDFFPLYSDICNPTPGGYGPGGVYQYSRLDRASELDHIAALKSASWGLGQVMGDNYNHVGYVDVRDMVDAFCDGEDAQLAAIAAYICNCNLVKPLKAHNWAQFAEGYNGPGYARNMYDKKLDAAYKAVCKSGLPNLQIRARQISHMFEGTYHGNIDGLAFPVACSE